MIGALFLLALFSFAAWKAIQYMRREPPEDRGNGGGWWPKSRGPRPMKPGPDDGSGWHDFVPPEFVEAHGKWAKKIIEKSRVPVAPERKISGT